LTGRVEDLTFQLLQIQEQMRKMQEDIEFRFQELEGGEKRGDAGSKADTATAAAQPEQPAQAPEQDVATQPAGDPNAGKLLPSEQDTGAGRSDGNSLAELPALEEAKPRRTIDGVEVFDGSAQPPDGNVLQPRDLGSLRFDQNGNIIGAEPGQPVDLAAPVEGEALPAPDGSAGGQVAALPQDPAQLYDAGYNHVQAGDYKSAEAAFREFTTQYPKDARMGEASFWLGESVFAQGRYEEAAKIFLDGHKKYPKSRMGPQNLLKLGVSLAGMNQRELACATYAEVPKKYPNLSNAVRAKVATEQKAASCAKN
jgi:tol-pal system protein YbgF